MATSHLDDLIAHLHFPSISTDPAHKADMLACAQWLEGKLAGYGFVASIHPTPGHPVVLAEGPKKPGRPTVLIYGHYDVQPVDPLALWKSPPFEPRVENGVIFARGATDNKGQHLAHVIGAGETLEAEGDLPVNVVFLIEGEEEIGSPNLETFLEANRERLACDIVAISDTGMVSPGVPTFTYGLRGIACVEAIVRGPAMDLHSGIWGGSVANPADMVARLVASLHDADGRVTVPGFYDDVADLNDWEREAWANLPGEGETLAITGVGKLFGEAGFTDLERRWARPTAEVNGIGGGYQGEGSKTVIPSEAMAKLSFRLVPNQNPADITAKVKAHLESVLPDAVTVEVVVGHSGKPYLTDPHTGFGKAAQDALRETFPGVEPALIREGGSIPIVQTFKDVLGAETLLLGLALPDCQIHAPNENFPVENFEAGIRLNKALLAALARA